MYSLLYALYVILSTLLALSGFWWALRNGQFTDQQRARYLPLHDGTKRVPPAETRFHRYQAYGLFGLLTCGLLAALAVIIYALLRAG